VSACSADTRRAYDPSAIQVAEGEADVSIQALREFNEQNVLRVVQISLATRPGRPPSEMKGRSMLFRGVKRPDHVTQT